jgi:hypothetical protein
VLGGEELVLRGLDRGWGPALHRLGHEAETQHARHLGLGRELGNPLAKHRILSQWLPVALFCSHVLAEQLEPLLDGSEGEHGESLQVERFGDVLEALVELSDPVLVTDPGVVEEDLVGDLALADGGHRLHGQPRAVQPHQEEGDPAVLGSIGVGPCAEPVPLGEVRGGGEDLLAVEAPPIPVAGGLQGHGGRVGARLRLAVADGELDIVLEDLGQELALELVAAVSDQRLSDDADALADLRPARARQAFVQEVLVDALTFAPAVLLGPGHAQPAAPADLLHEGASLGGVYELGHVLAAGVHDLGVVVLRDECVDFFREAVLLLRELEVHGCFLLLLRCRTPVRLPPRCCAWCERPPGGTARADSIRWCSYSRQTRRRRQLAISRFAIARSAICAPAICAPGAAPLRVRRSRAE